MSLLSAQSVQSIGDLFLVRVFRRRVDPGPLLTNGVDVDVDVGGGGGGDIAEGNFFEFKRESEGDSGHPTPTPSIEQTPSRVVSSWVETAAKSLQEQWPRHGQEQEQPSVLRSEYPTNRTSTSTSTDATATATPHPLCDDDDDDNETDNDNENENDKDDCGYDYYRNYIVHHEESFPRYSLACSYLLVQRKHCEANGTASASSSSTSTSLSEQPTETTAAAVVVVGHGRLTECYESAGGNASAATYILIRPEWRGKGYGKKLLRLLESEAGSEERLGCRYHFVYLWCKKSTAPFYEQIGYKHSRNRVSLQRPCLKALAATSVQSLEAILRLRQQQQQQQQQQQHRPASSDSGGGSKKKLETVVLLPSSSSTITNTNGGNNNNNNDHHLEHHLPQEEDVWLRKRLVDHVESIQVPKRNRLDELNDFVQSIHPMDRPSSSSSSSLSSSSSSSSGRVHRCCYYRWNPCVPWQMQIGPSCGLTAIRMVRDFYATVSASREQGGRENTTETRSGDSLSVSISGGASSSLLVDAQIRGFTQDGELFDACHLRELMEDQLRNISNSDNNDNNSNSNGCVDSLNVRMREMSTVTVGEIDSTLRRGGLWILPYDSHPRSKLPCKMHGKHAHWGILVGILCDDRTKRETTTTTTRGESCSTGGDTATKTEKVRVPKQERLLVVPAESRSTKGPLLVPLEDGHNELSLLLNDGKSAATKNNNDACDGVYWMVQHSLSSKWSIASMNEWVDSNRQLVSVNDDKFTLGKDVILNLANRIVQILPEDRCDDDTS